MKLVVYKGHCKTLIECGRKFTDKIRSYVVDDDTAKYFSILLDFDVIDLDKEFENKKDDIKNENKLNKQYEAMKSKLTKLSVDTLKEMCEQKGLETTGKKDELIERLLNSIEE